MRSNLPSAKRSDFTTTSRRTRPSIKTRRDLTQFIRVYILFVLVLSLVAIILMMLISPPISPFKAAWITLFILGSSCPISRSYLRVVISALRRKGDVFRKMVYERTGGVKGMRHL